jgi:small GTP-binding protein
MWDESTSSTFILALVGNSSVGKTCLMNRFVDDSFSIDHVPTVGCDIRLAQLRVGGELCKLTIRDTAGQEIFHSLVPLYCRNVHGAIIAFSITDESSFDALASWINLLHEMNPTSSVVVFGNKSDLAAERTVTEEQANHFCREQGFPYVEGSAKTGQNISDVFTLITRECMTQFPMSPPPGPRPSLFPGSSPVPICKC